jgi:hypothetical protein
MKTDMQLKADVTDELAWDPSINAAGIGVMVKDGVVTLSGHLDTFAEKHAVEKAVRRVADVRGIALEFDVKLSAEHKRSDSESNAYGRWLACEVCTTASPSSRAQAARTLASRSPQP